MLALVAISFGCASGSMPTLDPVLPQTVAVNETLRLTLSLQNPDNVPVEFSFRTDDGDDLGSTATITGTSSGAQFRWSPITSQVGLHSITFVVTSAKGVSEQTTVITVVSARDQAPVFLLPGAGGSYDLGVTPCVDFEIEVRDEDSTNVEIRARGALPDSAARITMTGSKGAEFHWCPTPEQVSAQERWTIRMEADDGDHPPTPHDYIAVLRNIPKPSCPGDGPTVSITAPSDGDRVSTSGTVNVTIAASDDMGLRDAPLLYYSLTAPTDLDHPNFSEFDDQIEAEMNGANWVARIPSMDLEIGEERTLYIAASATDNDDTEGTDCDHRADTAAIMFVAVGAPIAADVANCEPCFASAECTSGFCAATAGGGMCLSTCELGGSCDRGTCEQTTTVEGGRSLACGDAEAACSTAPMCTDDSREDNDETDSASAFSSPITNGVICSGDDDFFRVTAAARSRVTATLDGFVHSAGDLDLQILSGSGSIVAASEGTSNSEVADACAGTEGFVYVRVLGYDGAANTYSLNAAVEPNVCCTDDAFEPDNTRTTARAISGTTFAGSICPANDDYLSFTTTSSRTVTATIVFDGTIGDLDLDLYDASGILLADSDSVTSMEQIVHVVPAGTFTLRVHGWMDAAAEYTGSLVLSAP